VSANPPARARGVGILLLFVAGCGAPSAAVTAPGSLAASGSGGRPVSAPAAPAAVPAAAPAAVAAPAAARRPARPLLGRIVALDPGHNGGNGAAPAVIAQRVPNGAGGTKECDTAGASTDDGYPEHAFTYDVAQRTAALLRARGARVVLTRPDDRGVGPCVDRRAAIGNAAHADLAVSIHADGGPPTGRGFHLILGSLGPVSQGRTAAASHDLALALRAALERKTGTRPADYTAGSDGLDARGDLAGLNLSRVPKVFVECANMRSAADARLLRDPGWRQRVAVALADGVSSTLENR